MASVTACAPAPNGAGASRRWAPIQMRLASSWVRGWDFAPDIACQSSRIRMILFAHDLLRKTGAHFADHAPKKKPRGPQGLRGEAKAKSSRVALLRHAQLLHLDVVPAGAAHLAIAHVGVR